MTSPHSQQELRQIYQTRFEPNLEYRRAVWRVLFNEFIGRFVRPQDTVLDLGCGYGEFINQAACGRKLAMDLNPACPEHLERNVRLFTQNCSHGWPLEDEALDVVFTSNFFEHLPDKIALGQTLDEIRRCLKPGGRLIALGPNIRYLPGRYWDFWDHHLPLSDSSLAEALTSRGLRIAKCIPRFLPYSMSNQPRYPLVFLRLYLHFPPAWRLLGKQFFIVAER
jgi:SAM-dependent methyltransferase